MGKEKYYLGLEKGLEKVLKGRNPVYVWLTCIQSPVTDFISYCSVYHPDFWVIHTT